jgi:SAM-dependent methyltransferase
MIKFEITADTKELISLILKTCNVDLDSVGEYTDVAFVKQGEKTKIQLLQRDKFYTTDGHLGGCSKEGDPATWTPGLWTYFVNKFGIKSVIDIGCGFGHSTQYFQNIVEKVVGIEGSESIIFESNNKHLIRHHDYATGPLKTELFDMAWSCEFVEHVDEIFLDNFIQTFKCAKYVLMTYAYPGQGGHHHVNEQPESYWIDAMERNGFEYLKNETIESRKVALEDGRKYNSKYNDNHFSNRGLIFLNKAL